MLRVVDKAFRTDTGRQRSANEDSFFVRPPIFVVADGMGGAQAGEVASKAAAEADVRIDDRYASGVHARIFTRDRRTYVEDMNSTNGTLLNDAQLKGEAELLDGDIVRIGDTEFRFEVG